MSRKSYITARQLPETINFILAFMRGVCDNRPHQSVPGREITQLLISLKDGDRAAAASKLMPLVYDEFKALAARHLRRERANHTLQPTALVHEAYLRLIDQTRVDWQGRTHFFAVGAQAIRRILVDHARQRNRDGEQRGGYRSLDEGTGDVHAPATPEPESGFRPVVCCRWEKLVAIRAKKM